LRQPFSKPRQLFPSLNQPQIRKEAQNQEICANSKTVKNINACMHTQVMTFWRTLRTRINEFNMHTANTGKLAED